MKKGWERCGIESEETYNKPVWMNVSLNPVEVASGGGVLVDEFSKPLSPVSQTQWFYASLYQKLLSFAFASKTAARATLNFI